MGKNRVYSLIPPLHSALMLIHLWVINQTNLEWWLLTKGRSNRWTTVLGIQFRLLRITMSCFLRNNGGRPQWICAKQISSSHLLQLRSIKRRVPQLKVQKNSPLLIRKSWLTLVAQVRETIIRKIREKIHQPISNIFWWLLLTSKSQLNIGRFIGFSTNRVLLIIATRRLSLLEPLSKGKRFIYAWIKTTLKSKRAEAFLFQMVNLWP